MKQHARSASGSSWARLMVILATAVLGVATLGSTALGELPEHGHVMLVGVRVEPESFPPRPVSVRNCVDLAANQALPLHAHHSHLHFGTVNEVFAAHTSNVVVPVAPFPDPFGPGEMPWSDCASLLGFFGLSD